MWEVAPDEEGILVPIRHNFILEAQCWETFGPDAAWDTFGSDAARAATTKNERERSNKLGKKSDTKRERKAKQKRWLSRPAPSFAGVSDMVMSPLVYTLSCSSIHIVDIDKAGWRENLGQP
ncbi:Fc.00g009870.m01.CDS01 [Cosmosporella sp. VM-42]